MWARIFAYFKVMKNRRIDDGVLVRKAKSTHDVECLDAHRGIKRNGGCCGQYSANRRSQPFQFPPFDALQEGEF